MTDMFQAMQASFRKNVWVQVLTKAFVWVICTLIKLKSTIDGPHIFKTMMHTLWPSLPNLGQ